MVSHAQETGVRSAEHLIAVSSAFHVVGWPAHHRHDAVPDQVCDFRVLLHCPLAISTDVLPAKPKRTNSCGEATRWYKKSLCCRCT